jgi:hypothetical protein
VREAEGEGLSGGRGAGRLPKVPFAPFRQFTQNKAGGIFEEVNIGCKQGREIG